MKKLYLFILIYILFWIGFIEIVNYNFKLKNNIKVKNHHEYFYDSMNDGDIIEYDSVISGEMYGFNKFFYKGENYFFTRKGQIESYAKLCYCKSIDCLTNYHCDKAEPLLSLGSSNTFKYSVMSYNEIFNTKNKEYNAWSIYYFPINFSKLYPSMYIAEYYDVYLVPIKYEEKKQSIKYTDIDYKISEKDDNWVADKDNNSFYTLDSESGSIKIKFKGKKGDAISFDIKSSINFFEIYLNGKKINEDIGIKKDENDFFVKYVTKKIDILEDDKYEIEFKINKIDTFKYLNYKFYLYIKNFKIERKK